MSFSSPSENIYLQHGLTEIRASYELDIFNNPKIKNKTLINSQDQKDETLYDSDIQSFSYELNLLSQDSNKDLYSHLSRKEQFNSIDEPLSKMLIDVDSRNNLDNKFVYYEDNLDKKELNIKYIKGIILEQMVINYSNVDINYKNNEFFKKIYYNNNLDKNNYISINNYENYNNFNNTNNTKINEAYKNSLKGVSVNKSFSKHVDKRKKTGSVHSLIDIVIRHALIIYLFIRDYPEWHLLTAMKIPYGLHQLITDYGVTLYRTAKLSSDHGFKSFFGGIH